jgi:hypothetical protein
VTVTSDPRTIPLLGNVPRLLQVSLAVAWAFALLFLAMSVAAAHAERHRLRAIGTVSLPRIIAGETLQVRLSDLDAHVVSVLFAPSGAGAGSVSRYLADREAADRALIDAAMGGVGSGAGRTPASRFADTLSTYERLVIAAQTMHQRGDERGAAGAYSDALAILQGRLLPAADAVARANDDALQEEDAAMAGTGQSLSEASAIASVVLVALLVAVPALLRSRAPRALNPAVIAAAALTVVSALLTQQRLSDAREQARTAHDAFRAVSSLWEARVIAHNANADVRRWLAAAGDRHDAVPQTFDDKTARLLRIPEGSIANGVASFVRYGNLPDGSTGFLEDELRNVAFPGERDAATALIRTFSAYVATVDRLRDWDNIKPHAAATGSDIGMDTDIDSSFGPFDAALGRTIDVDQAALNGAIDRGLADLRLLPALLATAVAAVGLCALGGILPLLRAYRR